MEHCLLVLPTHYHRFVEPNMYRDMWAEKERTFDPSYLLFVQVETLSEQLVTCKTLPL